MTPTDKSISDGQKPVEMANNENDLLTLKQAATFMRIKPRTLYDWVSRRRVPFLRAGRSLRFSKPVLVDWMKERAES